MARIRSIHPGFFTDETVVTLNPQAQVFLIGLWTECDDQGVFEWKPVRLKMRLLPVSNVDVGALLEQLATAEVVKKVEVGGIQLGLVRNFCKFQRPKKPKNVHVIPSEFRTYLGLTEPRSPPGPPSGPPSGELEPLQDGSGGEISPQMEEGGGRMEGRRNPPTESVCESSPPVAARETHTAPRAGLIPPDWEPSEADIATLRRGRPDLVGPWYETQMAEFRDWCRAKAVTSHDIAATWRGFMRKAKPPPDAERETYEQRRLRLCLEEINR